VPISLTQALATLRAARWVDLTHPFAPGIPHYAAFPDEQRTTVVDYDQGFRTEHYGHVGQWGTHVDPPSHFIPGGRTLDQLPVTDMLLELVVLDAREQIKADPDYAVDQTLITRHEAEHGPIPADAFVALRTGWSARWPDADAMQNRDTGGIAHYPGWTVDALRFLVVERGIRAVGHEQTDTDPGTELSAGRVDAERYLLGQDRWQVEMLTGLDDLPERGGLVLASWAKPQGGSGFPARCIAIVP
jgi:kynurenine formamidase